MPLALHAVPDFCAATSSSSLVHCSAAVPGHGRGRIRCRASDLVGSFPSFAASSRTRLVTSRGSVVEKRCQSGKRSTGSEEENEVEELGAEVGEFGGQGEVVKVVAVLAGCVACHHACGETLAVEAARLSDATGVGTDWSDFQAGFSSSFLLILFSEVGDKTFFIAALLATRKSNLAVFAGTFGALAVMTVISVALGRAFHYLDNLIPSFGAGLKVPWDDLAAAVLLLYFGVSTLLEAASMEVSKADEEKQDAELAIAGVAGGDGNVGLASTVAATFVLVFVAEWGDKSFFSTIALAAASSPLGVVTGAIAGHGVATVLAVLGGSFLSEYVSEKLIAYVGGVLFLVFAATTLVEILT